MTTSLPQSSPPSSLTVGQVPAAPTERQILRTAANQYVKKHHLQGPLTQSALESHVALLSQQLQTPPQYTGFLAICLHNALVEHAFAAIPMQRRLLLLPKCLRHEQHCQAPMDELGLLCQGCGQCVIEQIQREAQALGYVVLVAEGSAAVLALLRTGQVEAILGVSCLSVLAKAFAPLQIASVPGLAVPLLNDGCHDTTADLPWLREYLNLQPSHNFSPAEQNSLTHWDALHHQIDHWFTPAALSSLAGTATSEVQTLALEWLTRGGKRWRPFIAAAVADALSTSPLPDAFAPLALAVECFHKASLVHDDIEDADPFRYNLPTLHESHGIPIAINIGDFLIGEGYRQITLTHLPPERQLAMLRIAAEAHRTLCIGQGAELAWSRTPRVLTTDDVLNIFAQKTAPAFEVALRLGAYYHTADATLHASLTQFATGLGIAYQIRDDLEDLIDQVTTPRRRPTLPMAILLEEAPTPVHTAATAWWENRETEADRVLILQALAAPAVADVIAARYDAARQQARAAADQVAAAPLRDFLSQLMARVFMDFSWQAGKGWCREFTSANAASRPPRPGHAG